MEMNKVPNLILVLVVTALLVGVGVLALLKFGDAAKDKTYVSNETVTIAASAGQIANDELYANPTVWNGSQQFPVNNGTGFNVTLTNGEVDVDPNTATNTDYNFTYYYWKDNEASTALNTSAVQISPVNTTWMTLIVTILVLVVILTLVIRSFGRYR